jgi:hypothetical protein
VTFLVSSPRQTVIVCWGFCIGGFAMLRPKIVILGERSGIVRDAFRSMGCFAVSVDLQPSDKPGLHIQADWHSLSWALFDLVIAHPVCTYLCNSGIHWNSRVPGRTEKTEEAIEAVKALWQLPVQRLVIENPTGVLSNRWKKPNQIIQPWQFGDDASKATCLWLRGVPELLPTNILPGGKRARRGNQTASGQNKIGPSPERAYERAKTYLGIANAMAFQWTHYLTGVINGSNISAKKSPR